MTDNDDGSMINPETKYELLQQLRALLWIKHILYLVPCRVTDLKRSRIPEIAVFTAPNGKKYVAAFTGPGELRKWPYEKDKAVLLTFDDLKFSILEDPKNMTGIIIDPFGKGLVLDQKQIEQIDRLTEGFGIHAVEHSKAIQLSKPTEEKPELIEALNEFFSDREEVYKAYMLMVNEPEQPQPHLLFIVDFDGARKNLFPSLAKVICPHIKIGGAYEMVKATYKLLHAAASVSEPIYRRRS